MKMLLAQVAREYVNIFGCIMTSIAFTLGNLGQHVGAVCVLEQQFHGVTGKWYWALQA